MQPILMLAVVGVAAIALGTGFLNNDINLWIQQFGVGSGDIESPVDHALVDFEIVALQDPSLGTFKNLVQNCEITPDVTVGVEIGSIIVVDGISVTATKQSEITCKITDRDGQIIAEGTIDASNQPISGVFDVADAPFSISVLKDPLDATSWPNVFEVHDVIVVIHANTYSMGDDPPIPPPAGP